MKFIELDPGNQLKLRKIAMPVSLLAIGLLV